MKSSTYSTQPIHVPVESVNVEELIQRLTAENCELRQIIEFKDDQIDKLTNMVACLKESVQLLRDEIAILKGQKPKPKIKPSDLEGSQKKLDWHKRFHRHSGKEKPIVFCSWVNIFSWSDIPSSQHHFKMLSNMADAFQIRALKISRSARLAIKEVRRIGKRGQPRGKPRKKKRH